MSHEQNMISAYLMEGIRDAGTYQQTLDKWDRGCLELVDQIVCYAPFLEKLGNVGHRTAGSPGVFEYEVVSLLGSWLAVTVRETGELPSQTTVWWEATRRATEFYTKDITDTEQRIAISLALFEVLYEEKRI